MSITEHELQSLVIQWRDLNSWRHPSLRWLHSTPNGAKFGWRTDIRGQRYSPEAKRQKDEGLTPGILDLFLPWAAQGYHGFYLELKAPGKLNEVRDGQREFMAYCETAGILCQVLDDYDDIVNAICWYLGIEQ